MDQEPAHRRKKGKALKSCKVRTADSTVIKWITWPHKLMYTSGGEPMTHELISMSQCVTGNLSVLDTVKAREKQCMLKHLKELMADTSMYGLDLYEPIMECGSSSSRMAGPSGRMLT